MAIVTASSQSENDGQIIRVEVAVSCYVSGFGFSTKPKDNFTRIILFKPVKNPNVPGPHRGQVRSGPVRRGTS